MGAAGHLPTGRVAILVDCDNADPHMVCVAMETAARFGRVLCRRGYGNHATLANKWQCVLSTHAFTPVTQFQAVPGKNTADIALAIDAIETLLDDRADTFCLVTSDSDFTHLCKRLRERGARVIVVGQPKTPSALRDASDDFFEWTRPALPGAGLDAAPARSAPRQSAPPVLAPPPAPPVPPAPPAPPALSTPALPAPPAPSSTPARPRCPKALKAIIKRLCAAAPAGTVPLSAVGSAYLASLAPGAPRPYPKSGLTNYLQGFSSDLRLTQAGNGSWSVCTAR